MGYLHDDREQFQDAIEITYEQTGIMQKIIEKDYYVTMLRRVLAEKIPYIIFKGGTSLSKCHKVIKRFSEDIDITIDTLLSKGQKKRFKQVIVETAEEKEFGISAEVLRTQLKVGFHGVSAEDAKNIWVAYEPVWSIGVNGTPASADYAEEMHKVIKATLCEIFGDAADEIPALYGGSVNPGNACDLIVQPSIDGLFTGRAAWQADKFNTLIRDAISAHGAK